MSVCMSNAHSEVEIQSEKFFLRITMALVLVVGVPAFFSVVHAPTNLREEGLQIESSRGPASVVTSSETSQFAKAETLSFDCNKEWRGQELKATHLRIKAINCEGKAQVTNQSNGFTASLVYAKKAEFTTDFIDLVEGKNDLVISAIDSKGKKVQKNLRIDRVSTLSQ